MLLLKIQSILNSRKEDTEARVNLCDHLGDNGLSTLARQSAWQTVTKVLKLPSQMLTFGIYTIISVLFSKIILQEDVFYTIK